MMMNTTDILQTMTTPYLDAGGANEQVHYLPCQGQHDFDSAQMFRVVASFLIAGISLIGNLDFLTCLYKLAKWESIHVIALNLCIADLAFTMFVTLFDTGWNITMIWKSNEASCKFLQFLRSFSSNISSLMIVVLSIDRAFVILHPKSLLSTQKRRTLILVGGAWIISIIAAVPTAVYFGLVKFYSKCPDKPDLMYQCADWLYGSPKQYHMFQMALSFLIPLIVTTIAYALMLRKMYSLNSDMTDTNANIDYAVRRTFICAVLVTSSFILLWGPYWALGIFEIFFSHLRSLDRMARSVLICIMYLNAAVHPFICGCFFFKTSFCHLAGIPSIVRKLKYYSIDGSERNSAKNNMLSSLNNFTTMNQSLSERTLVRSQREEETDWFANVMKETKA